MVGDMKKLYDQSAKEGLYNTKELKDATDCVPHWEEGGKTDQGIGISMDKHTKAWNEHYAETHAKYVTKMKEKNAKAEEIIGGEGRPLSYKDEFLESEHFAAHGGDDRKHGFKAPPGKKFC